MNKDGQLKCREPGTPLPALSKEEKKRNRPSLFILPELLFHNLTFTLRLPYACPTILQLISRFVRNIIQQALF